MTMEGNDTFYFMSVCQDFVKSSIELREAAELCENDEIKQKMVSSIKDDFDFGKGNSAITFVWLW